MAAQRDPLSTAEVREKVKALLVSEVRGEGPRSWYYISMANKVEFRGGFYVRAMGPTDALLLLHSLGWWERGCSTQTTGPIPDETMEKNVPAEDRWRKLTREEVTARP